MLRKNYKLQKQFEWKYENGNIINVSDWTEDFGDSPLAKWSSLDLLAEEDDTVSPTAVSSNKQGSIDILFIWEE